MSQSRSDVWGHFVAENQTSAKCKHCDATIRRHGNTTNLREHLIRRHSNVYQPTASTSAGSSSITSFFQKKIDPSGDKAKEITAHIANVCVKELHPFSIVKDAGFRALIKHAWPTYQIPKRGTIRQLVMFRHTAGIKALKSELERGFPSGLFIMKYFLIGCLEISQPTRKQSCKQIMLSPGNGVITSLLSNDKRTYTVLKETYSSVNELIQV